MSRRDKRLSCHYSEQIKSIVRHIQKEQVYYSPSSCVFHFNRQCLTLLNNFDSERFHCLYADRALRWCSYSLTKSCDVPEHFYDLIVLNRALGDEYVLPFAGHFRESSGHTIGMFRQNANLYPPRIVRRTDFAETFFTTILFSVAVCHRMGGNAPDLKHFSMLYTENHPVLCDVGQFNSENRERLTDRREHFNVKKWKRFMRRKTHRNVVQTLKIYFPNFFQKKKSGKRCVLNEESGGGETFSEETHRLVCSAEKKCLLDVLKEFKSLLSHKRAPYHQILKYIDSVEDESLDCYIEDAYF